MGIINVESIVAYTIDGDLVCTDCVTQAEETEILEDDIITEDSPRYSGDNIVFCDRCKKRLN